MFDKVFIGRQDELAKIQAALDACRHKGQGSLINIFGGAGVGKSELLHQGALLAEIERFASTGVIDLAITTNQDALGLASVLATNLGDEYFPNFHQKLLDLDTTSDELRIQVRRSALDLFLSDLTTFVSYTSATVLMDTMETIDGTVVFEWITTKLIRVLANKAVVLVAGRSKIDLESAQLNLPLRPFTVDEVRSLAQEMYLAHGEEYDLEESLIASIHQKSDGHPILASLAFDLVLWTGDPDSLTNIPASSFGRDIALHFTKMGDPKYSEEYSAITIMAILDKRLTDHIYSAVRDLEPEARSKVLDSIRRLSFVKYYEKSESYSLHDKMIELLTQFGMIPLEYSTNVRRRAIQEYYLPEIDRTEKSPERQALVLETIHYLLTYARDEAYELFTQQYANALNDFELVYCARLIRTIRESAWPQHKSFWLDLLEAELQLKRHSPFAAARLFERVCAAELIVNDQQLMSRAFEGLGRCSILGCEIAGENVSKALGHLERAMAISEEMGDRARSASVQYAIGLAFEMLGNHRSASDHYTNSVNIALNLGELAVAADTADRLTLLLRRAGRVFDALEWAQKSLDWRTSLGNHGNLASSYHNLGTVYRDLRNRDEGVKHLETAIHLYSEVGDHLGEAQALKDLGWTYFVFKDKMNARKYAEKSLVLCERYGFGRIKGEALHTIFEVVDSEHGENASIPLLEEAIQVSREHGGIFMLLDLLMHQVVIDRRTGNYAQIPERIREMEDYINRGCQFHYFLGRALVVWGDCMLESGDMIRAFAQYRKGYYELALGGESAAFMSSYKQHIEHHLPNVLVKLDPEERQLMCGEFTDFWTKAGLAESHPEVLVLCLATP